MNTPATKTTTGNEILLQSSLFKDVAKSCEIEPEAFLRVLKASVLKPVKTQGGGMREVTNEEFLYFLSVAKKYHLNPLTKEIYGFVDTKTGAVVPIVSTDGWTNLMVNNKEYTTHNFEYAQVNVTMDNAKPCPEWCEVVIKKKGGQEVRIREYLDEVYREAFKGQNGIIKGPWQTHTKRMLRHKSKIQGAREAFGFSGIYDEDEAERIIEAQAEPGQQAPAQLKAPVPLSEKARVKLSPELIQEFETLKIALGGDKFQEMLIWNNVEKIEDIADEKTAAQILEEMRKTIKEVNNAA